MSFRPAPTTLEDWKRVASELGEAYELRCNELEAKDAEIRKLEQEARGRRRIILNLERQLAEARGEGSAPDQLAPHVHELGAYWREKCNHPKAMIDGRRYRAVRARLMEGLRSPEAKDLEQLKAEIREAIDGAAAAPNVNDRTGERYDDLELICRNQSKLDSFRARAPKAGAEDIKRKLIGDA